MTGTPRMGRVHTGLERLIAGEARLPRSARVGLLCHPASVDANLCHASRLLLESPDIALAALFSPQHGFYSTEQDNMIETPHALDPSTGLVVHSLYSETRKPTEDMLREIDVLVVDLQDVGCRVYTFVWTMALCMQACAEAGKAIFVLDRPNPIGDAVEGCGVDAGCESFVGLYSIPMRHGMTIGELAIYLKRFHIEDCDLSVVEMKRYASRMHFPDTGLPWVGPSPNMPTYDTALVYPGMVLLEGTNVSEGRGTTRPFEVFGAPWLSPDALCERLAAHDLRGVRFRPLRFEPTFHKFAGQPCGGAQVHVTDRDAFRPWRTGLAVLSTLLELHPKEFAWRPPPYEYEEDTMPVDILTGSPKIREAIERGVSLDDVAFGFGDDTEQREACRLYA